MPDGYVELAPGELARARKLLGLNQVDFAARISMNRKQYNPYETGKVARVLPSTARRFAVGLAGDGATEQAIQALQARITRQEATSGAR